MEKMTVGDFKRYCESKQFRVIRFARYNQDWRAGAIPVGFQLAFQRIMVSAEPDVGGIFLGEGDSQVYFERVKHVMVDEESSVLGTVIRVVCGDSQSDRKNIQYTLVAN